MGMWVVTFAIFALWLLGQLEAATSIWKPCGFDKAWPPISEDEFIARCSPGTNRERALAVRRIVSEQLGIPYDQVYPEQNFVSDLGCN